MTGPYVRTTRRMFLSSVALGAAVTCTITNTDNTPTLKLVKVVTNNDGGLAQASDYTLSATASAPDPITRNFSDSGDSTTFHNVFAGAAYALAESPNPGTGYSTSGEWSCSAGGTLDAFTKAIAMSGTFDLTKWLEPPYSTDYYFTSPIHFVPNLPEGPVLDALRRAWIVMPTGSGPWEEPAQSWRLAHVLGSKGVPNRVDDWGPDYDHNWNTWREMLPKYLGEMTA